MARMIKILLVCTGNLCRSSMAEALAEKLLKEKFPDKSGKISFSSAGVSAFEGLPATQGAIDALRAHGIDLRGHRSRLLSIGLAQEADLILTMTGDQKERVKLIAPDVANRVFTLKEYNLIKAGTPPAACDYQVDITDPTGEPMEVFEACIRELEEELTKLIGGQID